MKTIIFILIISVSLFVNAVNANQCTENQIIKGVYNYQVTPNPLTTKIINDIYFEDLKWRKPDLKFVEETKREYGNNFSNNYGWYDFYYLSVYLSDGTLFYQSKYMNRATPLWNVRYSIIADYYSINHLALIPVLTSFEKSMMDFTCLALGFQIINPDYGFIVERWDGERWLKPNQKSQRNWGETGSLTGPVR